MNAQAQLDSFIGRFTPAVAADARHAIGFLSDRLPTATKLVYDNYNALVVGFGANDKASGAILSIALYPQYVRLFFLRGIELDDPCTLLEGSGSHVRSIKLKPLSRIESAEVGALIDGAVAIAEPPLPPDGTAQLIIKSISAKQRPRKPG